MTFPSHDLIGPLYFGAKGDIVPHFLRPSFDGERPRRSVSSSLFLSTCMAEAYEDGAYEEDGSVLEVWLQKSTRWRYLPLATLERCDGIESTVELSLAERRRLDAVRLDSGQVWCVWNPAVVSIVRRLDYREAIPLLCSALDEAGPTTSFGGVTHDYASIWWARVQANPRLATLSYRQQLERVLRRYMGRKRSRRYETSEATA